MFTHQFSAGHYNRLTEPENAYDALKQRPQFEPFLEAFADVTDVREFRDRVGVWLLHRHFDAGEESRLVEWPATLDDGTRALVTARRSTETGCPARWSLDESVFAPMEYVVDRGAAKTAERLSEDRARSSECARLLRTYELDDLLGLCVVGREHLRANDDEVLSEKTYVNASVVTLVDREEDADGIPTVWVPEIRSACTQRCNRSCSPRGDAGHGSVHSAFHGR